MSQVVSFPFVRELEKPLEEDAVRDLVEAEWLPLRKALALEAVDVLLELSSPTTTEVRGHLILASEAPAEALALEEVFKPEVLAEASPLYSFGEEGQGMPGE